MTPAPPGHSVTMPLSEKKFSNIQTEPRSSQFCAWQSWAQMIMYYMILYYLEQCVDGTLGLSLFLSNPSFSNCCSKYQAENGNFFGVCWHTSSSKCGRASTSKCPKPLNSSQWLVKELQLNHAGVQGTWYLTRCNCDPASSSCVMASQIPVLPNALEILSR